MPTITFTPVLTDAGFNAAVVASGSSLQLAITHIALGAAKYTPNPTQTAMLDRREKTTVGPGSSGSAAALTVLAAFAEYTGADYDIGEIGFYAGDPDAGGVLFAIASRPGERYGVRTASAAIYTASYRLQLTRVPAGSVTVTIDPLAPAAAALWAAHEAAANPHPQYLQEVDGCPIGMVGVFDRPTPPPGWLHLNGAEVSRTTYGALWAVVSAQAVSEAAWTAEKTANGVTGRYSVGNGTTTFRLPDTRGAFTRAVNTAGTGRDASRVLGSAQADAFASHTHGGVPLLVADNDRGGTGSNFSIDNVSSTAAAGSGTETRPVNVARLECVKAGRATLPPV